MLRVRWSRVHRTQQEVGSVRGTHDIHRSTARSCDKELAPCCVVAVARRNDGMRFGFGFEEMLRDSRDQTESTLFAGHMRIYEANTMNLENYNGSRSLRKR